MRSAEIASAALTAEVRRGDSKKLATLTAFPLRDMALATIPINDEPDFKAFSCDAIPDFQVQKIVHLALGIFWKSAVRTWNMIDGAINRIDLGPYQEPVRQFLYGTGPFPENMYLMAYLDASNPPLVAMSSPRRFLSEKFHLFIFYLNGLQCVLLVGKQIPEDYRASCIASAPDHPIFLVPSLGETMFHLAMGSPGEEQDLQRNNQDVRTAPKTGHN